MPFDPYVLTADGKLIPDAVQRNLEFLRDTDGFFVPNPIFIGITAGAPAFQGTWVNIDGNNPGIHRCAYYYRDRGRVYLGGVISGGVNGTTAFTLPPGYRPMPVGATLSTAYAVVAQLDDGELLVNSSTGTVQPQNVGGSNVNGFCFLDGVSFFAAS